jgi:hypothetical protein
LRTQLPDNSRVASLGGSGTQNPVTDGPRGRLRSATTFLVCRTPAKPLMPLTSLAEVTSGRTITVIDAVSAWQRITMHRLKPPAARISWRKSTYSLASGECVEVATVRGGIAVRDSNGRHGVRLFYRVDDWQVFIAEIKSNASLSRGKLFTVCRRLNAGERAGFTRPCGRSSGTTARVSGRAGPGSGSRRPPTRRGALRASWSGTGTAARSSSPATA